MKSIESLKLEAVMTLIPMLVFIAGAMICTGVAEWLWFIGTVIFIGISIWWITKTW